jgi:HAD superfamily hydrolase (TIGR01549 family)
MYKYIIFDVDGTLIETEPAVVSSYQRVFFEEFGRYLTVEELFENYMVPTYERMRRFGFKNVEEAVEKFHTYLMEAFCNVKAYKGILSLLEALENKDISMGVVTARSKREVEDDPCLQSLVKHFKYIICADDTQKHKPESEPLFKIFEMMNANPFKSIYIGDTYSDYMCAKNADVDFGLAVWGAKKTDGIIAEFSFEKPEDILNIL